MFYSKTEWEEDKGRKSQISSNKLYYYPSPFPPSLHSLHHPLQQQQLQRRRHKRRARLMATTTITTPDQDILTPIPASSPDTSTNDANANINEHGLIYPPSLLSSLRVLTPRPHPHQPIRLLPLPAFSQLHHSAQLIVQITLSSPYCTALKAQITLKISSSLLVLPGANMASEWLSHLRGYRGSGA